MVETNTLESYEPYYFEKSAKLSEGVTFMALSKTLFWVDIINALIHRVTDINDLSTHTSWQANFNNYDGEYPFEREYDESIGVVFPIDKPDGVDEIYFGAKYGLAKMKYSTGKWKYVIEYHSCGLERNWKDLRSNDGNVSPDGEIFIGIMHDFHSDADVNEPKGALLKLSIPNKTCTVVLDKVAIPNAINWTAENDFAYFTDSLKHIIWKIPYQNGNLVPDQKQVFIDFKRTNPSFQSPEPDGSFIDPPTNYLITAVWSTNTVQRYDTSGKLVYKWFFPSTARISCCALADGDMFVTTANENISRNSTPNGDLGGAIWRVPNVSSYCGSSKRIPIID